MILSIDPGRSYKGEASIGYALFAALHPGYAEQRRGRLSFEELRSMFSLKADPWLLFDGEIVHEVVIEDYVNNARSKGGQRNGTSECIGMVETFCWLTNTPFTRQEPAALGAAKLHAPKGSFKELKHLRHEDSAFLHGFEFLVRRGDIKVDLSSTM